MQVNRKNPTREAVSQLYYATVKYFETIPTAGVKISDLRGFLKTTIPKISKKPEIRKVLLKEAKTIIGFATNMAAKNHFDRSKLMYDLFDGILLTKEPPIDKKYDAVVLQTPSKIAAHVWYPSPDEVFDELEIKLESERDFNKKCSVLLIKNPIAQSVKTQQPMLPGKTRKPKHAPAEPHDNKNVIGKIRQSSKLDYRLNENPDKDQIYGVIFEKYAHTVRPNDILKIENNAGDHKLITRVVDIKAIPISAVGVTKQFSELSTQVKLRPMMEVTEDYKGKPRPGNISGYDVKRPTDAELIEALHVPSYGIPVGWIDYNNSDQVFYYPLEPKDSIYQSMMIAGVQNKGKSNFVKFLLMGLTSMEAEP